MSTNIKISIITATYNCVNTLTDCFSAVSRQDYSNYEHIVVDGASTDGTVDLIHQNIHQIKVFTSAPDKGIYDALNKGLALASGDVIGFLHADDLFASDNVLSKIAAVFDDPSVCAVYGDLQYVSKKNISNLIRCWRSSTFDKSDLVWGWMPPHPTLYVRREWYQYIGAFDIKYQISGDYVSILRLFSQPDFKSVYVPMVFVLMRTGGKSNRSVRVILKKSMEDWRALRAFGFGIFGAVCALLWKNIRKVEQLW
ncbi:glycosyltransferase [Polynucleobacter sp. MWH-CaK5]|uniref:glycosyltransferase family 2 protein n=1 Tax=Polynucleobacter sp. MWH-CaK5 TaxID=2689107 RepID=UPI001BFEDE1B|nr:glycosyltransferase family 2 protein [Polynucleobacter sp. MWH-CaK5]QWD89146.1 glycosyltransferase [Polynucleobacter sp. MWH-CaK5]